MDRLCEHFQVTLENAHDARADSKALAECVSEALHRGVMVTKAPTTEDDMLRNQQDATQERHTGSPKPERSLRKC